MGEIASIIKSIKIQFKMPRLSTVWVCYNANVEKYMCRKIYCSCANTEIQIISDIWIITDLYSYSYNKSLEDTMQQSVVLVML